MSNLSDNDIDKLLDEFFEYYGSFVPDIENYPKIADYYFKLFLFRKGMIK